MKLPVSYPLKSNKVIYFYLGHKETVDLLIRNGATLEMKNKFGYTALMQAALDGNEKTSISHQLKDNDLTQVPFQDVQKLWICCYKMGQMSMLSLPQTLRR